MEFGTDKDGRPPFITTPLRYRFRLMELMLPGEELLTYAKTSGGTETPKNRTYNKADWFSGFLGKAGKKRALAENVVALILLPKLSKQDEERRAGKELLAQDYSYDSTVKRADPEINPANQLPPLIQVTMVAIDEPSARRLAERSGETMPKLDPDQALFRDSRRLFDNAATSEPGDGDLAVLEKKLIEERLGYRVFTSDVIIRAARWSRDQKN